MGYGTVISGGPDGRYVVQVDYGEWMRVPLLEAANQVVTRIQGHLTQALARLAEAEAREAEQRARIAEEVEEYIAIARDQQIGQPLPQAEGVQFERGELLKLQVAHQPLRTAVDALKFDLAEARKMANKWASLVALENRPVWCVDFTEDRAPGEQVGLLEIPGEPGLIVMAPGARGWQAADGFLLARLLNRPDQAFYNAAVLPGVLKWKPTYRWGTITAIYDDLESCDVDLGDHQITGQRFGVNQSSSLSGVQVEYMECGHTVFEVGDRVVVKFTGQDWAAPKIIGFLDTPRPCNWMLFHLDGIEYHFECVIDTLMSSLISGSPTVEVRVNGGAWQDVPSESSTSVSRVFSAPFDTGSGFGDEPRADIQLTLRSEENTNPASSGFGFPPRLSLLVSPSWPLPPPPRETRNIFEFRVIQSGALVFNAAVMDMGWGGEGVTDGYAKSKGGIRLQAFPNSAGVNVLPLDYELTGGAA